MTIQNLEMIADASCEQIRGGGTATGSFIQLDQIQARLGGYNSAAIASMEGGGAPNSWGKHVSGYVSHLNY